MCAVTSDDLHGSGTRPESHVLNRLADLLSIDISGFWGEREPLLDKEASCAPLDLKPDLQEVLSRIEDEKTRAHMAHLITTLETLKADAKP